MMRNKKTYILIFILLTVLFLPSVSLTLSHAVWIDGKVTRDPWMIDSHYHIEVNKITYKILPDIRITYRYMRNKGAYNEKTSAVYAIFTGQKITMKVREKDVIQIILF